MDAIAFKLVPLTAHAASDCLSALNTLHSYSRIGQHSISQGTSDAAMDTDSSQSTPKMSILSTFIRSTDAKMLLDSTIIPLAEFSSAKQQGGHADNFRFLPTFNGLLLVQRTQPYVCGKTWLACWIDRADITKAFDIDAHSTDTQTSPC